MKALTKAQLKTIQYINIKLNNIQFDLYALKDELESGNKQYASERVANAAFDLDQVINNLENAKTWR